MLKMYAYLAAGAVLLGAPAESQARLKPSGPIVCKNNQRFSVRGVRIVTRGVAVVAEDNCALTIVGSTIRARVALKLSGNAKVVLVRSDVSGTRAAVAAADNAELLAKGGVVRGAVRTSELAAFKRRKVRVVRRHAKVGKPTRGKVYAKVGGRRVLVSSGPGGVTVNTGRGGATVRTGRGGVSARAGRGGASVRTRGKGGSKAARRARALRALRSSGSHRLARVTGPGAMRSRPDVVGAPGARHVPKGLKAGKAIVCGGARTLVIRNRYVRTTGAALKVMGGCDVTLINTHLISIKGTAIEMVGSGDVKLVRSYVRGARRALSMLGSGDLVVNGSTVIGKISKVGSGRIKKIGRAVIRRHARRKRR